MQMNRIAVRIFIFCTAFLLGFSVVEYLVSGSADEKAVQETVVEFSQPQAEQETGNPPCRQHFDRSKYDDLSREELRLNKLLVEKMESLENPNLSAQKSAELKAEVKSLRMKDKFLHVEIEFQRLDKIMKDERKREQGSTHTLIYVADCIEYNEPR